MILEMDPRTAMDAELERHYWEPSPLELKEGFAAAKAVISFFENIWAQELCEEIDYTLI